MPVWDLTPKDIKPLLQRLARHKCYLDASNQHRKDFRMPAGILDFDLTCGLRKSPQLQMSPDTPIESHFQSQLVGCTLTRDRLFAASLYSSDKCRFCDGVKESLTHLVLIHQLKARSLINITKRFLGFRFATWAFPLTPRNYGRWLWLLVFVQARRLFSLTVRLW